MRLTAAPGGALPSFPCTLVAIVVACVLLCSCLGNGSSGLRPSLFPRQQCLSGIPKYLVKDYLVQPRSEDKGQIGGISDKKEDEE